MDGRLSKNTSLVFNMCSHCEGKMSADNHYLSVRTDSRGIVFTLTDYRQPLPIHAEFLIEDFEDEVEFINPRGLWQVESTLKGALAQIIQRNASFN